MEEVYEQFKNKHGEMYEYISDRLEDPERDLTVFDIDDMNKNLKSSIRMFNKAYKEPR